MSRIMLGLKNLLVKSLELSLIIFDEIDSGVSGFVASQVAKKMKSISKTGFPKSTTTEQLWLVGEGDLSVKLRELVKSYKLDQKVKFKGYLKPTELPEITAKATIGLNLLENTSLNYYYSLANKAFDYIQAEIPAS